MDLARILAVESAYHAAGAAHCFARGGAVFLRDPRTPRIYDTNHARHVRTDDAGVDGLLEAVQEELTARGHRASIRLDPFSTPPSLEARLCLDGWECEDGLLMALEGELRGHAAKARITPIESEADWATYLDLKLSDDAAPWVKAVGHEWIAYKQRKAPRVRSWLAALDGQAVGFFSEFVEDGVGMLEDLYVHPAARLRGVGTALVGHLTVEARRRGARVVFLAARAADTPKWMYAKMGFVPVGVTQHWLFPETQEKRETKQCSEPAK